MQTVFNMFGIFTDVLCRVALMLMLELWSGVEHQTKLQHQDEDLPLVLLLHTVSGS